jgi:hypothetical protein
MLTPNVADVSISSKEYAIFENALLQSTIPYPQGASSKSDNVAESPSNSNLLLRLIRIVIEFPIALAAASSLVE